MTTLVLEHLQHADSASPDITIDSSGRVGIGTGANVTTNAHANADDLVIGNTSTRTGMTIVSDPAQSGAIHFSDGTSTGNANIKGQISYEHGDNSFRVYANSTTEVLRLTSSGGTVFNNGQDINQNFTVKTSGNANALFIDGNGGNVGIGTDDPDSRLHIKAGDSGYTGGIQIEDNDSTTKSAITHVNGTLYISSNTTVDHISILANGNVGIGTVDPQAILDIRGNTTTYGGMSKIYLTDVSNHAESKNWAIGNGGSGFGHFTIGLSNAKDGDPMENGTHTTPLIIDETGKVALYSTTISNDAPFWAANISEAQDSRMAFRIQPTRGSVNKGISIGAVGKNSSNSTGIQAYDTSSNTANTLELNPHGGAVTTPYQPCFSCYKNGSQTEQTGNVPVTSWTENFDTGSNLDAATGRFTAPIAGKYYFCFSAMHSGALNGDLQHKIFKNGAYYQGSNDTGDGGSWDQNTVVTIIDMAQGDYAEPYAYSNQTSSSAVAYTDRYTGWHGYLIG